MQELIIPSAKPASQATAESLKSTFHEQVVEHIFIAELLQEAWLRYDKVVEVMRSEVDAYGYDLVLECNGIVRHVQLKASDYEAKTSFQKIGLALGAKPSGCVVWIKRARQPEKRFKLTYLFFGNEPKHKLDDLMEMDASGKYIFPEATHTKPSKDGSYKSRPAIRKVKRAFFKPPQVKGGRNDMSMAELFIHLFGLAT